MKEKPTEKRKRGRPPVYVMPEQIPDTPENVAKVIMSSPPKAEWKFMKELEDKAPKKALQEPEGETECQDEGGKGGRKGG